MSYKTIKIIKCYDGYWDGKFYKLCVYQRLRKRKQNLIQNCLKRQQTILLIVKFIMPIIYQERFLYVHRLYKYTRNDVNRCVSCLAIKHLLSATILLFNKLINDEPRHFYNLIVNNLFTTCLLFTNIYYITSFVYFNTSILVIISLTY